MANELVVTRCERMSLTGYVDRQAMRTLIRRIRRGVQASPRTAFVVDCTGVEDFCGYALADLVDCRRQLQWQGADVMLARCPDDVIARLAVPLFESLVVEEPAAEANVQKEESGPFTRKHSSWQAPHFLFVRQVFSRQPRREN